MGESIPHFVSKKALLYMHFPHTPLILKEAFPTFSKDFFPCPEFWQNLLASGPAFLQIPILAFTNARLDKMETRAIVFRVQLKGDRDFGLHIVCKIGCQLMLNSSA